MQGSRQPTSPNRLCVPASTWKARQSWSSCASFSGKRSVRHCQPRHPPLVTDLRTFNLPFDLDTTWLHARSDVHTPLVLTTYSAGAGHCSCTTLMSQQQASTRSWKACARHTMLLVHRQVSKLTILPGCAKRGIPCQHPHCSAWSTILWGRSVSDPEWKTCTSLHSC